MDLMQVLPTIGYTGIFLIIFAESCFVFFLPGDSLLFTAGLLATKPDTGLNIHILALISFLGAVLGNSAGYAFGKKIGKRLFHKKDSLLFSQDNLDKSEKFYEKHGKMTIIIARFIPVVRTFAPIVAGVGSMNYSTFVAYNIVGGLLWAVGLCYAGYYLGKLIPNVDHYLLPIVGLIVILSVLPSAYHILKDKKSRDHLLEQVKKLLKMK
jgi:membrane-associated protein